MLALFLKSAVVVSRVLPLIEYGAHGSYVVICPQEGELHLTPDSPEWFDWLATLSSFRFVGQQGRFSAYRKGRMSRRWSAYRTIHQHDYQHYLGTTDHLTIDCLEQMAAKLQSYMAALSFAEPGHGSTFLSLQTSATVVNQRSQPGEGDGGEID